MKAVANKRWVLVNRKTRNSGRKFATRAQARASKTDTQLIFDLRTSKFVR